MDNGASQANDETLREQAREAVQAGRVPGRRPDRVLGGLGRRRTCAVCNQMITLTQMELEIEYRRRNGPESELVCYWLHPRCFAAWEAERQVLEAPASNGWRL